MSALSIFVQILHGTYTFINPNYVYKVAVSAVVYIKWTLLRLHSRLLRPHKEA